MNNGRILIFSGIGLAVVAVILALTTGVESLWWTLLIFGVVLFTIALGLSRKRSEP